MSSQPTDRTAGTAEEAAKPEVRDEQYGHLTVEDDPEGTTDVGGVRSAGTHHRTRRSHDSNGMQVSETPSRRIRRRRGLLLTPATILRWHRQLVARRRTCSELGAPCRGEKYEAIAVLRQLARALRAVAFDAVYDPPQ